MPVPMEYASLSEQEKIAHTEKYYEDLSRIYQNIESGEDNNRKRVNFLLEGNVDLPELLTVLKEVEMKRLCHYRYDFWLLFKFCQIAQIEESFNEPSVLRNISGLEEVVEKYQRYMFLLRRFEFGWEEENELVDLIKKGELSYICLSELMGEKSIIQKIQTICRIAEYLYKEGCCREAILYIMRLEQILPYSKRKVLYFAMTLLNLGEQQLAYEVLMKCKNPEIDVKNLQNELSKILGK